MWSGTNLATSPTCAIMSVLSWTLMLLLLIIAGTHTSTCTSVAPQDADSFCLNLPSRPETNPRQVILLDTANYRAQDLVTILGQSRMWISLKFLPGPTNQKVCLALRMHACVTLYIYMYYTHVLYTVATEPVPAPREPVIVTIKPRCVWIICNFGVP